MRHWFTKKTMLKENLCHTSAEVCSIEELLVLPKHSMRQAYHNSPIFLTTLTPLIGKIKWDEANNFDINKEKLNLEVEKSRLYFSNFAQCLKITQNVSFNFWILAFSITKTDLPGNTVWPKASGCQKRWMRPFSVIFKHCAANKIWPWKWSLRIQKQELTLTMCRNPKSNFL